MSLLLLVLVIVIVALIIQSLNIIDRQLLAGIVILLVAIIFLKAVGLF